MTVETKLLEIGQTLRPAGDQYLEFQAKKDLIARIIQLRDQKNVLILGHNYMAPLVYNLSEKDGRGDSLALSMYAAKTDKPIILFDGVRFMAETAKILNPDKKVLIADVTAGCSLADNFTGRDVLEYKARYPGAPIVTYINSYADVKAESDYCCTSGNAIAVILHAAKEFNTDKVVFTPDSLMGRNLQDELLKQGHKIDLIYPGKHDKKYARCEVHERITAEQIRYIRQQFGLVKGSKEDLVFLHYECPREAVAEADAVGSTFDMAKHLRDHSELKRVYLGTECEMTANLEAEFPNIQFVKTCMINCQHMAKITLEKILNSLENEVHEIKISAEKGKRALIPIQRMLEIGRR